MIASSFKTSKISQPLATKEILSLDQAREMMFDINKGGVMSNNPRSRFLPVVTIPAIMSVVLMPTLIGHHVTDGLLGGMMGVLIGLAIVGFIWIKNGRRCSTND